MSKPAEAGSEMIARCRGSRGVLRMRHGWWKTSRGFGEALQEIVASFPHDDPGGGSEGKNQKVAWPTADILTGCPLAQLEEEERPR